MFDTGFITPSSPSTTNFPQTTVSRSHSPPQAHSDHPHGVASTRAQDMAMQYHEYVQHQLSSPMNAIAHDNNYFDCPKVWERIVSHPRFDEVDVEALCAELNAKVRIVRIPDPQV